MVRGVRGDEELRDTRRRPTPPRDEDVKVWHSLSARPEQFFYSQLPLLGLNPYMKMLVHDSESSFNPLLFCLYDQHYDAIRKRDMWINSSWPLAKEAAQPLSSDPLELERVAAQVVYWESANRMEGGLEALFSRDYQTAAEHLLDGYLVLTHRTAE
jgi:hypothetical protein